MHAMNDVVTLVCEKTVRSNGIPQTKTIGELEVFAKIASIKRNEHYAADREGIKLDLSVYINVADYEAAVVEDGGKKIAPNKVEYDDAMYRIYRTYRTSNTEMELILQRVD